MATFTLLVFTLVLSSIQPVFCCPSGWLSHNEKCYLLSSFTATWPTAASYCRTLRSKLAEPMDQSSVSFLGGEVKESAPLKSTHYYIGGGDFVVEGEWIWVSTQAPITVTNWNPGEPNHAIPQEDCLQITTSGMWIDLACDVQSGFICEMGNEVAQSLVG